MISHTMLGTNDLEKATAFYDRVLGELGCARVRKSDRSAAYGPGKDGPPIFWICKPYDGKPAGVGNGTHVAFLAPDRASVDRFHAAALALGGKDEGAPGPRDYSPHYYGGYVRDLDGNKIQACCFKPE